MSRNDTGATRGGFAPFRDPVTPPDADPFDGPLFRLDFSEEWLPFVLGALKVLARPETWKRDDLVANDLAVQRGHDLLSAADRIGEACPDWYFALDQTHESFDASKVQFSPVETDECAGQERAYTCDCDVTEVGPATFVAKVALSGYRADDHTPCGGHVTELRCEVTDPLAVGNAYILAGRDCLDNDLFEIVAGNTLHKLGFSCKWLAVTAPFPFDLDVGISGPVLCSEA
jgi:hypothetical protein